MWLVGGTLCWEMLGHEYRREGHGVVLVTVAQDRASALTVDTWLCGNLKTSVCLMKGMEVKI